MSEMGAAAWAAPLVGAAVPARAAEIAVAATPGDGTARKLGVALVGLGRLSAGQLVPALQKTKLCRLTALVSGSPEKARQWAQQHDVSEKSVYNYENFDSIRDNPDVDIVYVVLPNSMHAEYTIRAARAGKHVLCEKPMAVSVKECDAMIAACRDAQRQLAIGYRLHFDPYNLEMMRLSREKVFGPVRVIETAAGFVIGDPTQWRLKKSLAGGGSLLDVGVYALQAARYIAGEEPVSVTAQWAKTDAEKFKDVEEESIQFALKFPGGAIANCTGSYGARLTRWHAAARDGWFEMSPAFGYRNLKGRTSGPDGPKEMQFPEVDHFAAQMDDFADCILTGRPTSVPGEEGRRDQRIMAAIYEAAAGGRTVAL
jgi:predicted dehydrogenase